jgi:MoaA/NifB/PqqE/SkfB family radical SAM enzyme
MWQLNDPPETLTKEARLTVVDQLSGFRKKVHVEVTGGEPFTKINELFDIAKHLKNQGNTMGVVTSGFLLKPSVVDRLEGSGISHIAFSIDFPTAEQQNSQRGRSNTFECAINAIRMLIDMKKEGKEVPTVGIDSIIMEQNLNYLEDIALLAKELEVNDLLFQPVQPDFGLSDQVSLKKFKNWLPINPCHVSQILDQIEKLRGKIPISQTKEEFKIIKEYFYNPIRIKKGSCISPQNNLVVDVTGKVLHCFGHGRTGLMPLGTVPKDNIVDLWESEKAIRNREFLSNCNFGCGLLLCHNRNSKRGGII